MQKVRILPLLILVAMLSFVVRLGDIVTQVRTPEQVFQASASAEEKSSDHGEAAKEGENAETAEVPAGLPETEPAPLPEEGWADPTSEEFAFSETQTTVLKELRERRDVLDKRERQMDQREALLKVTEKQIEEKISELTAVREEIEGLLGKQSEEEKARMDSLVKIYEGMKPKDAAEIFNNLDMDILLEVVSRMSERKSSPIIAAMSTERAQRLTTLLAEQLQLPELPQ